LQRQIFSVVPESREIQMADATGVATVIQSALQEIGVAGKLKVSTDDGEATAPLDGPQGELVKVTVKVEDLPQGKG
jgi:hypothetical protein